MALVGRNFPPWVFVLMPCLVIGCTRVREVQHFCNTYLSQCSGVQHSELQGTRESQPFSWKYETPTIFFAGDDIVILNANGVSENSFQDLLSTILASGGRKSKLVTLTSLLEILVSFFDDINAEFSQSNDDIGDDCDQFISLWSNIRDKYKEKVVTVPYRAEQKPPLSEKPTFPDAIFIREHPSAFVSTKPTDVKPVVDYSFPKNFYSTPQNSKPEEPREGTRRPIAIRVEKEEKPSVTATTLIQTEPSREANWIQTGPTRETTWIPTQPSGWRQTEPSRITNWKHTEPIKETSWIQTEPRRETSWKHTEPTRETSWIQTKPTKETSWQHIEPTRQTSWKQTELNRETIWVQNDPTKETSWIQTGPVKETLHEISKPISFVVERKYPPTIKLPRPSFKPSSIDSRDPLSITTVKEVHPAPTTSLQKFTFNFEKSEPVSLISYQTDRNQKPSISKTTPPKVSVFRVPQFKPVDNYYSQPKFEITLGSNLAKPQNTSKPVTAIYDQYKPIIASPPQSSIRPEVNFSIGRQPNLQRFPVPKEQHPEVYVEVIEVQESTEGTDQLASERPALSQPGKNYGTVLDKIEIPHREPYVHHTFSPDPFRISTARRPDPAKPALQNQPTSAGPNFVSRFTVPSRNTVQVEHFPVPEKAVPGRLPYKPNQSTLPPQSVNVRDDPRPASHVLQSHATPWIQADSSKVRNYSSVPYEFITQKRDPQAINVPTEGSESRQHISVPQRRLPEIREEWKPISSDAERFARPYSLKKPEIPQKLSTDQLRPISILPTVDQSVNQYELPSFIQNRPTKTVQGGQKFNLDQGNSFSIDRKPGRISNKALGEEEWLADYVDYPEIPVLAQGQKFGISPGTNFPVGSLDLPSNNAFFSSGSSSIPNVDIDYIVDYRNQPQVVQKGGLLNSFGSLSYDSRKPSVEEYIISDSLLYENYDNIGPSEFGSLSTGYEDGSPPSYLVTDYLAELEYNDYGGNGNAYHGPEYTYNTDGLVHAYDQGYPLPGTSEVEEFFNVNGPAIQHPNDPALYTYDSSYDDYSYFSGNRGSSQARQTAGRNSFDTGRVPFSYVDSFPQINSGADINGVLRETNYQEELLLGASNLETNFYADYENPGNFREVEGFSPPLDPSNPLPLLTVWDDANPALLPLHLRNEPAVPYSGPDTSYYSYEGSLYDEPSLLNSFQRESEYAEEYSLTDIFPSRQDGFGSGYKLPKTQSFSGSRNFDYGGSDGEVLVTDYLSDVNYVYEDLQSRGLADAGNGGGTFANYPLGNQNQWTGLSNQGGISSLQFSKDADAELVDSGFENYVDGYDTQVELDALLERDSYRNIDYLDGLANPRNSYGDQYNQAYGDPNYDLSYLSYDGQAASVSHSYDLPLGLSPERPQLFDNNLSRISRDVETDSSEAENSTDLNFNYELKLDIDSESEQLSEDSFPRVSRDADTDLLDSEKSASLNPSPRKLLSDDSLSRPTRDLRTQNTLGFCTIQSSGCELYCDGFWVIIQNRNRETSRTFDRSLRDYRVGFGDAHTGYWMGLECLHHLTTKRPHQLLVEVTGESGRTYTALYESFSVDDYFQLHLGRFVEGDAGDGMRASDGALFSTYDQDLDYSLDNCAAKLGGGWWHRDCEALGPDSSLNGDFSITQAGVPGVRWGPVSEPVVATRMLIKPSLFLPTGYDVQYLY